MTSDKTYYFVHYGYGYYMWQMEVENFVLHRSRQKANVFKISYLGLGCDMCCEFEDGILVSVFDNLGEK